MDPQFVAQHPPERVMLNHLTEIGKMTLDQVLDRVLWQLEDLHPNGSSKPSFAELVGTIRASLRNESSLIALLADWDREFEVQRQRISKALKEASKLEDECARKKRIAKLSTERTSLNYYHSIQYACLHAELARNAKIESNTEQAWVYACEASYRCGAISENSLIELDNLTIEKTSRQNSNNAKKINKKIETFKKYLATLIIEHSPQDGWPTNTEAMSKLSEMPEVQSKLKAFFKEHKITRVSPTNIKNRTLQYWANEPGVIRDALKAVVRKPKA